MRLVLAEPIGCLAMMLIPGCGKESLHKPGSKPLAEAEDIIWFWDPVDRGISCSINSIASLTRPCCPKAHPSILLFCEFFGAYSNKASCSVNTRAVLGPSAQGAHSPPHHSQR